MLPRRHSIQPSFPNTFNTSPNRWEDRSALKRLQRVKTAVTEEKECVIIFENYRYLMRTLRAPSGVTSVAGANM